jgi:hypothetical protein
VPVDADDDVPPGSVGPKASRRQWRRRGGRHARPARLGAIPSALLATLAGVGLAVATIKTTHPAVAAPAAAPAVAAADIRDISEEQVSRGSTRARVPAVPAPGAAPPAPVFTTAPAPVVHPPVAGLTQTQTNHAVAIIETVKRRNLPRRAAVIAIITALQESQLRNHANSRVPASLRLPHEGVSADFDSIGLFQQRPSQGWGTVTELMTPSASAARFLDRLVKVPNWDTIGLGAAAQAVQRSAFPDAYDRQQGRAEQIVTAIF